MAHYGLILEGISQAFSFQILAGLIDCLGMHCEALNSEIFQPCVSLHDNKIICQISCQKWSLSMGLGAMMLEYPKHLLFEDCHDEFVAVE